MRELSCEDAAEIRTHVPIYCINLARSPDRRRAMSEQAERLGLAITFVEAIDGRDVDPLAVPEYMPGARAKYGRPLLLPNAVACALSHKRALETFVASGAPAAVILEDDSILDPEFEGTVSSIVAEARAWDLVKLWRIRMRKGAHFPVRRIAGSYKLVAPLHTTNGAVAILYSREGAQKALRSLAHFYEDVDTHLGRCWKTGLRILEVRPHVVRHAKGPSSIDGEMTRADQRKNDTYSFIQGVRRQLFKLTHSTLNPICAAQAAILASWQSRNGVSESKSPSTLSRSSSPLRP